MCIRDRMKNPGRAREVLAAMVKAVKKPVTVKFRKGFNDLSVNAVEFAKMAERCGVAAVAVHGLSLIDIWKPTERTRKQL